MCIQLNPKELIALYKHLNGERMRMGMKENILRKVSSEIKRMEEYKKQLLDDISVGDKMIH